MADISAAAGVERVAVQLNQLNRAEQVSHNPPTHDIVNLFEHLLGQKVVEPSGPAKDAIANILANPTTLGGHILANVEGMHQTFNEFSTDIESRLSPDGVEGMSLGGGSQSHDTGGITSNIEVAASTGPGPAAEVPSAQSSDGKDAPTTEYGGWQNEMQDLLWVQYNVGRILVHEEMMSKAAGKSTQNLDMLLRGQ